MKKRQIRWMIALMTVALVGLVASQVYWINHARRVAQERFDQNVQDALQAVVQKLQREEVLWLVSQRVTVPKEEPEASAEPASPPGTPAKKAAHDYKTAHSAKPPRKPTERDLATIPSVSPYPYHTFDYPVNPFDQPFLWMDTMNGLIDSVQSLGLPGSDYPIVYNYSYWNETQRFRLPGENHYKTGERRKSLRLAEDFPIPSFELYFNEGPFRNDIVISGTGSINDPEWAEQWKRQQQIQDMVRRSLEEQIMWVQRHHDSLLRANASQPATRTSVQNKRLAGMPDQSGKTKKRVRETEQTLVVQTPEPEVPVSKTDLKQSFEKVKKQSEIVQDVFTELVTVNRPIKDRINPQLLDSMLTAELRNQHIDIPFAYGVHSREENNVILASSHAADPKVPATAYKATLFPNDLYCEGNFLYVYFPTRQQALNASFLPILGSSAVLILVITGCFYAAIATILKQKKLSDMKNDFINNMTHEFKTPISTISLACEVLQDEDIRTNQGQMKRYLGIIRDENKRLGSQVEKVLQAAMLDRGNIKLKLTEVDLHDVIEGVLQNIGVQIEQRDGTIDLHLDADQTIVEADEVHITNVIYNLLDNANKYSPEKPQITVKTRSWGSGVTITVADKGIGMSREATQRIFEKFYRVPTGNVHNVKGFGLGLSYVKKIVDLHHGSVRVDSQSGAGSTFEIFLPYTQKAENAKS